MAEIKEICPSSLCPAHCDVLPLMTVDLEILEQQLRRRQVKAQT